MKRFWPVVFLFLLPVLPLWRCVFLGEAIGPFDQIRQMAPWNAPAPTQPWDVLQADGALQFYPWRDLVLSSWAKGEPPLWNPYELAGTPLLGNSQSAGFYPPHILLGVLHFPTAPAMVVLAWLHLFWAGLGAYFLSRRLGASKIGAVVAGASFELSAFMLAWTALPSVITTVAWIPWALAATTALFERATGRRLALLAFSLGMMVLAGHLQFVAYGFMAVVLMALILAITTKKAKPLLGVFAACVMGVLFSAPQLLPVLNNSQFSHRRGEATEEGYTAYVASAIKPYELGNLIHPYTLGSPRQPVEIGGAKISEYWPAVAKQGGNLAESAVTIGPLVLGLLFLVPWRDRRMWPLAAIGALALLLALGTVLNKPLYFLLPGWSSTGSPGRIIVLFVLAACVLAGLGCEVKAVEGRAKQFFPILGIVLGFIALRALGSAGVSTAPEQLRELVGQIASRGDHLDAILVALLVAAAAISAVAVDKMARFKAALPAVPVLLAALYASGILMTGAPLAPVSSPSPTRRVAVVNSGWDLLVAAPALLPPNTPSLSRMHELAGYDSLLHRETKKLLDDINGQDSAPPANGNMMFVKPSFDPAKAAEAGVTEVWSRREIPGLGEPSSSDGFLRYRLSGPGMVSLDGGSAEWVSQSLSSAEIRAVGPGRLVFRDRMMPGWAASIDGQQVQLTNRLWKEVDIPAGEHQVRFAYSPPGMKLGFRLFLLAVLIMAGGLAWDRRSQRSPTGGSPG